VYCHVLGSWTTSFTSFGMLAAALDRFDMICLGLTGDTFVVQGRNGMNGEVEVRSRCKSECWGFTSRVA